MPLLEENLRLNGSQGWVHVRGQAVTRASGETPFYRSAVADNSGLSSILPGQGRSEQAEIVACVTLDDFAATLPGQRRIDLMKIDVEGAEVDVLAGGSGVLSREDAPVIVFESTDIEEAAAVLGPHGYEIRRVHYTMGGGLELIEVGTSFHGIFDDYEPPNYIAGTGAALFGQILERASARQSAARRMLGRL
jgi:FkbM family methyltransferase